MSINNPNSIVGGGVSNSTSIAGTYTNSNITVNSQGIITNAANGSGGTSVVGILAYYKTSAYAPTGSGDTIVFNSALPENGSIPNLTYNTSTGRFTSTLSANMILAIDVNVYISALPSAIVPQPLTGSVSGSTATLSPSPNIVHGRIKLGNTNSTPGPIWSLTPYLNNNWLANSGGTAFSNPFDGYPDISTVFTLQANDHFEVSTDFGGTSVSGLSIGDGGNGTNGLWIRVVRLL